MNVQENLNLSKDSVNDYKEETTLLTDMTSILMNRTGFQRFPDRLRT